MVRTKRAARLDQSASEITAAEIETAYFRARVSELSDVHLLRNLQRISTDHAYSESLPTLLREEIVRAATTRLVDAS